MGVILDTTILIEWERRQADLEALLEHRSQEALALSVISAAELLHGVHRADSEARQLRRAAYVEGVLSSFPLFDFDLAAARVYASVWATLQRRRTIVSSHDLMIAATAISRGYSVATFNVRDYRKIEGLSLEVIDR